MSELFDPIKSLEKHLGEFDFNSRKPFYNDVSDYTTNAPSYYDDLARKNKLIKHLAVRIWDYDKVLSNKLNEISQRMETYIKENDELMDKRLKQWDKNLEQFDDEVLKLLKEWMDDGTFDEIINETIFNELNNAIKYLESRVINNLALTLKDFGAKGDGVTDDSEALRNALQYFKNNNGGHLIINEGTFIIKPELDTPFQLCSNLEISGYGNKSVLKVANDTGDYWGIFGQVNGTEEKIENFKSNNFRIDQNPEGNKNTDVGGDNVDHNYWWQFVFTIRNFKNVNISNMLFSPTTSVNTITLNDVNDGENASIQNNVFVFRRSNGKPDYDNSAVYAHCKGVIVTGNKFYSLPELMARGCVETHGGHSVISNNYSEGYYTGVNIVGREWVDPSNMIISNNVFTNCLNGLQFWVGDEKRLRHVKVSNNSIYVTPYLYDATTYSGITTAGSHHNGQFIEHLSITGNNIKINNNGTDDLSFGIRFELRHRVEVLNISDNVITGANANGISLGTSVEGSLTGVTVKNNFIKNCALLGMNYAYIKMASTFRNTVVENNFMLDSISQSKAKNFIEARSGSYGYTKIVNNMSHSIYGSLRNNLNNNIKTDRNSFIKVETLNGVDLINTNINDIVLLNRGPSGHPALYEVKNNSTLGQITDDLRFTYDVFNECYRANKSHNLKSGNRINVNGIAVTVLSTRGDLVYTSGSYNQEVVNSLITLISPNLKHLPQIISAPNGNVYNISVNNDGELSTALIGNE